MVLARKWKQTLKNTCSPWPFSFKFWRNSEN